MKYKRSTRPVQLAAYCALAAAICLPAMAVAQLSSGRPVRMIVGSAAAGPSDVQARLIVPKMSEVLGVSIIVDNRPSNNAIVGMEIGAKAPPDGHTLIIGNSGTHAVNATLYKSLPYDAVLDFIPVSQLSTTGMVVAANAKLPGTSIQELAAYAKGRPGGLNIAIPGATGELAGDALWKQLGIKMTNVQYKGSAPSELAVVSGEAAISLLTPLATQNHLQTGRMKAYGVTSATRSPVLPDVPTLAEQGVTGYDIQYWTGLFLPAKTPDAILRAAHKAVVAALQTTEVRDRLRTLGLQVVGNSPEEFRIIVKRDVEKFRKIIVESGIPRL
jgi:tripartite-type tricarboxylate transporter receptor subunit TctC